MIFQCHIGPYKSENDKHKHAVKMALQLLSVYVSPLLRLMKVTMLAESFWSLCIHLDLSML